MIGSTYDIIWSAVFLTMYAAALVLMILGSVALVKYIRGPHRDDIRNDRLSPHAEETPPERNP